MSLNAEQIRLVQVAVRAAGLRAKGREGRYRLLLRQYKQPDRSPVTSCKQLNNRQLEDLLGICEAHGFRMPGKPEDHFRQKARAHGYNASYAQREAIRLLAGDLGWEDAQVSGFIKRMTHGSRRSISALSGRETYNVIEALKAIVGRKQGKHYNDLSEVREDMKEARDGKSQVI